MANILLISYYFPPLNTVACRRVYGWAKYLSKSGHKVVVLTAETHGDEFKKTFTADLSFLEVKRVKYSDLLALANKIFKPGRFTRENKHSSCQGEPGSLISKDNLIGLARPFLFNRGILFGSTRMPTFSDQWTWPAYRRAVKLIKEENIAAIITSSPPPAVNMIALLLRRRFKNIPWLADFRDLWLKNPDQRGLFPFSSFERRFERSCMVASSAVITVSEVLAGEIKKSYPFKSSGIYCIENGFDPDMLVAGGIIHTPKPAAKKNLVYLGTLYSKRRSPEPLFEAVEKNHPLFKEKLEIIFYGPYETKLVLRSLFNRYPFASRIIRYGGFISAKEALRRESEADALLFIENDRKNDGVLTGKIFEYLMFKKPILCIGVKASSWVGRFLDKTGLCIFCQEDASIIAESLKLLIEDRVKVYPDEAYISGFSMENQVKKLDQIIVKYLKG